MNFCKKITLAAIVAAGLTTTAWANSLTLGDYFDAAALLLPNQMEFSAFTEVGYNDNIKLSVKGREIDSLTLRGGIRLDVNRTTGNTTYGVRGSVAYKYFDHCSHDLNGWEINVTPYVLGNLAGIQNLMFRVGVANKLQAMDSSAPRYTRSRTLNAGLTYDLAAHERWGIALTGDYTYKYYPQKEFNDFSKQIFEVAASPYYRFSDKLKGGVKVSYDETHFDSSRKNNDSYTITLNAFADYRMNQFFSVYGETGAEKKAYEGASRKIGNDRDWEYDGMIRMSYVPNKYWKVTLSSKYAQDDTTASRGAQEKFDNSLSVTWSPLKKFKLLQSVGCEVQDEKNCNLDSTEYYYVVSANYQLTDKLNTYVTYEYHNVQYKYRDPLDYAVNEVLWGMSYKF